MIELTVLRMFIYSKFSRRSLCMAVLRRSWTVGKLSTEEALIVIKTAKQHNDVCHVPCRLVVAY